MLNAFSFDDGLRPPPIITGACTAFPHVMIMPDRKTTTGLLVRLRPGSHSSSDLPGAISVWRYETNILMRSTTDELDTRNIDAGSGSSNTRHVTRTR